MKKVIGITGGIATGKSYVSSLLLKEGYEVIDSDQISHQLTAINKAVYLAIKKEFGSDYFKADGNLDRQKLSALIFNDCDARKRLNYISHPLIVAEIKQRIKSSLNDLIFVDIPLLFEAKLKNLVDEVICVYLDYELQVKRLMERDGITMDYAKQKIASQLPLKTKVELSDYVIDTTYGFEKTKEATLDILKKIKKEI